MAQSNVPITAGSGTNIDTFTTTTQANRRQAVVIADPATDANTTPVHATLGAGINILGANGTALDTNDGASSAGTPRVTISNNSTPIGALTETAPLTDTASSGLNGRLQRIAQRITSLIALVPTALSAGGNFKVAISESGTATPVTQSGTWTVQPGNTANTTAWKVDGSAVTQPVSGTVTANAGTGTFATNITQVAGTAIVTGGVAGIIAVGGNVANAVAATANPVPVGGIFTTTPATLLTGQTATLQFTAAQNAKTDITTVAGTALDTNSGLKSAGTIRVVLATDQPALTNKLLVTPDSVALPANQSVNISQINAVTPLMGGGTTGTGSPRVTVATDNAAIANWGHGATGSAVPANANYKGLLAQTGNPTAATAGNLVGALSDKLGKQVVVNSIRDLKGVQQTAITSSTAETTIVTAVASTFLDLYGLIISNTSATGVSVTIKDSTAGTTRAVIYVPATDVRGFIATESAAIPQATVNTSWTATSSASVASLQITALYVKNI